jgi:hypothetical protein
MIEKTAIICHGPSLQNSSMGNYIDSFQYVMRFPYLKNWQMPKDYGIKTSYFCGTVARVEERLNKHIPELGYFIWSKNARNKLNDFSKNLIKTYGGKDVTEIVESWRKKLTKCHHPYFSHGTAAVCIAAEIIKKPIVLLGADLLKEGNANVTNYIGSWLYEGRKPHRMGHPLDQERRIIDQISEKYKLKIVF